jgi:hypothetical protein
MFALDLVEVGRIFGLIVLVWFALVGWKLVFLFRLQRPPTGGPLPRQVVTLAARVAADPHNLWTH